MGIGTLRRHYDPSYESVEEVVDAPPAEAEEVDPPEATGEAPEVQEDPEENAPEAEGVEDPIPTPARNASKSVWIEFYQATGRGIPEDATRDSLAEAVLGPKE